MLFPQEYQQTDHKIYVVTVMYLLVPSRKEKTVSTDEERSRQ